jgi:Radical SAM superfamily
VTETKSRDVSVHIGGEPTLHPQLPELVEHALGRGLEIEVYTNLVHVTDRLWDLFQRPRVRLATSYYSPDAAEHDGITTRRSHDRTLANIREALRRHIRLRVGVIGVTDGQRITDAVAELRGLGVDEVDVDRLRRVGRGEGGRTMDIDQLCGRCADRVLAEGTVWPCVFARWMVIGNVRSRSLADLDAAASATRAELAEVFVRRAESAQARSAGDCPPVGPDYGCDPRPCKSLTQPCDPSRR